MENLKILEILQKKIDAQIDEHNSYIEKELISAQIDGFKSDIEHKKMEYRTLKYGDIFSYPDIDVEPDGSGRITDFYYRLTNHNENIYLMLCDEAENLIDEDGNLITDLDKIPYEYCLNKLTTEELNDFISDMYLIM